MQFEPNRGQYHPQISWVADVPEDMFDQYHGMGWCRVSLDPDGQVTTFEYIDRDDNYNNMTQNNVEQLAKLPSREPLAVLAMASGHQLCIEAGTASGAIISALTVKSS